jgi:hypothetical protein
MTMRLKSLDDLKGMTARPASQRPRSAAPSPAPAAAPAAGLQRLYALGRLKDGERNKTEERYEQFLAEQKLAGAIRWFMFEGIKLKLAPLTTLTIDFNVMRADGVFEMHDVKGSKAIVTDDARAKTKVAAAMFPFVFKMVYPRTQKAGGGWEVEEI